MNSVFSPVQQVLITWLLVLLTGWATLNFLGFFGELISILVTAALIAFLLNYPVVRLQRFLPRSMAALLVYLFAALAVGVVGLTVAPTAIVQARQLVLNLPNLLESGRDQLEAFQAWSQARNLPFDVVLLQQQLLAQARDQAQAIAKPLLSGIASQGVGLVVGTFNGVLDLVLILVISFYMLLDGERVWRNLTSLFSPEIGDQLTGALERNLRQFFAGQLLLGLFMGVTLSLSFWWLRVPFFLIFAAFIGAMEVIPFIGATLGIAAVGILVTFIDWWLALQVLGTAIVVQQIKDNFLAPRILGNLTGLSPVIIFASLLIGTKIGGLLGAILAIPLTGVVKGITEIVLDPTLPPQTGGAFFSNPLEQGDGLVVENGASESKSVSSDKLL
ncbi:MAG: AI-2E family transporter [Leptolyngbyaceae cyanobacterium bins.59]|nr:AI-2E family transporter [Leptolyngbyaceae cyanobacterium bins.59]